MSTRIVAVFALAAALLAPSCGPRFPKGGGPPIPNAAPAKPFTHPAGLRFVVLPAGGVESVESDIQLRRAILMSAHEVTNAQYEKFLAAYEPRLKSIPEGEKHIVARKDAAAFDEMIRAHKRSKLSPGGSHPVNNVTPKEAEAFCKWLTKADPIGRRYKLPDLVEWEYAARGGVSYKPYPTGDTIDKARACYDTKGPMRVGTYAANGYGLHDMAGNVAEWVWTDDMPEHELRGGSWADRKPEALRIGARGALPEKNLVLDHHGFRVLCEPPLIK